MKTIDYVVVSACILIDLLLVSTRDCALDIILFAIWLGAIAAFIWAMTRLDQRDTHH